MTNKKSFVRSLFSGDVFNEVLFPHPSLSKDEEETLNMKLDTLSIAFGKSENSPLTKEDIENVIKMGFNGLCIPKIFDGYGLSQKSFNKLMGNVILYKPLLGFIFEIIQSPPIHTILNYASDEQKAKLFSKITSSSNIISYALYEDLSDIDMKLIGKTIAEKSSDETYYIINGEKSCLGVGNSDYFLVFARTDKGLSCFFVEKSSGIEVLNNKNNQPFEEDFLTYSKLKFDNVKVSAENLIGNEGMGLEIALDMINISRINLGNICNVLLRSILDELMKIKINKSNTSSYNKYKDYIIKTSISVNVIDCMLNIASAIIDKNADFSIEASIIKMFCCNSLLDTVEKMANFSEKTINPSYKRIIDYIEVNKTLMIKDSDLMKYIAIEGLGEKEREMENFNKEVQNTNKDVIDGLKKFGNTFSKTISTIFSGFNILTGNDNQIVKSQKLLTNFNDFKGSVEDFGKSFGSNAKKLFDVAIKGVKNFKEEILDFIPNDFIGMSSINKVNKLLEQSRSILNQYLNMLRQDSIRLIKKYKNINLIPNDEIEYIAEIVIDMFALSSLISYVDYILNLDNKDAENVNYYVNMVILFSKELGKNMKYNLPFEDYDYSALNDEFFSQIINRN